MVDDGEQSRAMVVVPLTSDGPNRQRHDGGGGPAKHASKCHLQLKSERFRVLSSKKAARDSDLGFWRVPGFYRNLIKRGFKG